MAANIADLPSRGEFGVLESMGASRVSLCFPHWRVGARSNTFV